MSTDRDMVLRPRGHDSRIHNYIVLAERLVQRGWWRRGQVTRLVFVHDGWCRALKGTGKCDCAPGVILDGKRLTIEEVLGG